jgi:hypothetical protein
MLNFPRMNLVQYLARAHEIIGDRTADEERYDREVLRWLTKGKQIKKALAKANAKFPKEALQVDEAALPDVEARFQYLLDHEKILLRLKG